jgi:hypothetical protein
MLPQHHHHRDIVKNIMAADFDPAHAAFPLAASGPPLRAV